MSKNKNNIQDKLKEIYKKQDKIAPLIEGLDEIPAQPIKEYYIKLQTIIKEDAEKKSGSYEKIRGEKQEVAIEHIFDKSDKTEPSKLLVVGAAGVGKSTLMQYIAYKWSIGEIWSDKFDYVYRINLKTLLNDQWKESYYRTPDLENGENLLKCLIHYNLTKNLTPEDRRNSEIKVEDLKLLKDNSKILLLLDGYDEVAHLKNEPYYKELEYVIFQHKQVIITSRPNAVDKKMKEKFDRIIENTGLDNKGIEQYFTKYFKTNTEQGGKKGEELQEFLNSNAVIKDICHIPVNIAMLCYLWSEKGLNQELTVTNISDLYVEVVNHLGYRYFAKMWKGSQKEGSSLKEKLQNGEFVPDELKVLLHVAYKGITGGGVDKNDQNRQESLIIKGSVNQKDKSGISIQSSINYLADSEEIKVDPESKVTIGKVYKYGLLKTEKIVMPSDDQGAATEISETDLQKQDYSFLHLTFQEYLAACYLVNQLKNDQSPEKKEIYQFIAEHRNEPRYLMMLKFMAGIVTSEQSEEIAKTFWEAVTCNIDGIIELGMDTKLALLMHVLGQAKVKGTREIDDRIPNRNELLQLVDKVVLKDLISWGEQLKNSDYINDNIKQELLRRLSEKNNNIVTGHYVDIVSNLINKFSPEEQYQIIHKLKKIIIKETAIIGKEDWCLTKQAINEITKIAMQVNLPKKNAEKLIKLLMSKVFDINYGKDAGHSIAELLNNINDQNLSIKVVNRVEKFWTDNKNSAVRRNGVDNTIELVKNLNDPEIIKSYINKVNRFLTNENDLVKTKAIKETIELVKILNDPKVAKSCINQVNTLLTDKDEYVRCKAIDGTIELVKILNDPEVTKSCVNQVNTLRTNENNHVREKAVEGTIELLKILNDSEVTKSCINQVSTLWTDECDYIRDTVLKGTIELLKILNDSEVTKSYINQVNTLLTDENEYVRCKAIKGTVDLLEVLNDPEVTKSCINQVNTLWTDERDDIRDTAVEGTIRLLKILNDPEVTKSYLNPLNTLWTDERDYIRVMAVEGTVELAKILNDPEVAKSCINQVNTLLTDEDANVRDKAVEGTVELVKILNDPEVTKSFVNQFNPLLTDEGRTNSSSYVRDKAAKGIVELLKVSNDSEVTKSCINNLNTLLTDEKDYIRENATNCIAQIMVNLLLPKEEFTLYLNHYNQEVRKQIVNTLSNLLKYFLKYLPKCELLEKLLKDEQNLNIDIINKELFDNELNQQSYYQDLKEEIVGKLAKLANSDAQDTKEVLLADIKSTILYSINRRSMSYSDTIESVKGHKLIELALLVINKDTLSTEDTGRKELSNLAIDIITYQIERLSSEGLKWVNDNFEDLVSLSRESKWFVKILYHKVLEDLVNLKDSDSINLAKELIIKSINYGMTTSITKTEKIIFEGKEYVLKVENKDFIEEIARVVIDQEQDVLAKQYREHKPLLPKSGADLDKAAVDVGANSIVDNEVISHTDWRLSLMHLSDHKKKLANKSIFIARR
ncbi:MAG: NACHT domain-containing protein [Rickettsia endosymbiont of Labidopullus appendiculatus]|nr:NACHT domain-containing protein [Rickettsia endosymbiont of Labidopullus appendiculatus]